MAESQSSEGDKAGARLRQAEALIRAGSFEEAARVLAALIESAPKTADDNRARANYVLALARSGDCDKATKQFEKVDIGKLDDTLSLAVRYDRAWCLRKRGDSARAVRAFRELVDSAAESTLGRHAVLELAAIEMEGGAYGEAATLLESLVAAGRERTLPDGFPFEQVLYRLGKAQFELGKFDAAIARLGDLLKQFPKCELAGPAAYLAGEAAHQAGQFERVIVFMERAVASGADVEFHGPALLRLGDALNRAQRWADSEKRFGEYLAKHADSSHAYQARFGIGWARENDGRPAEAIESYHRVTADHKGPTAARAQFQIGQCLFAQKQYEAAVRELIKTDILYAYPEWSAAALFEAGRCFERLNRRGEARAQFQTVVDKYASTKWAGPARERLQTLAHADLPGRQAVP